MKNLFLGVFTLTLFSCNTAPSKQAELDSTNGLSNEEFKKQFIDSVTQKMEKESSDEILKNDTTGMSTAPIRVIKSMIVKKEYSSYRDIKLVYKNFSGKKVSAIKFQWYGINSFGEPADMGHSFATGFGGGFTDDPLAAGNTDDGEWSITSRDAKKVVAAWATEVVFTDGTKWKNKN